jgi:hypothetical protein
MQPKRSRQAQDGGLVKNKTAYLIYLELSHFPENWYSTFYLRGLFSAIPYPTIRGALMRLCRLGLIERKNIKKTDKDRLHKNGRLVIYRFKIQTKVNYD